MFDLERLLKVARLKQNQFGELMGVTDSAISKLKQGKMNLPEEWKATILEKLGLNADDFITDQVGEPNLKYITNGLKPDKANSQLIPLYSLNVEGGFGGQAVNWSISTTLNQSKSKELGIFYIPNVRLNLTLFPIYINFYPKIHKSSL